LLFSDPFLMKVDGGEDTTVQSMFLIKIHINPINMTELVKIIVEFLFLIEYHDRDIKSIGTYRCSHDLVLHVFTTIFYSCTSVITVITTK
jgi:hypothetical protein